VETWLCTETRQQIIKEKLHNLNVKPDQIILTKILSKRDVCPQRNCFYVPKGTTGLWPKTIPFFVGGSMQLALHCSHGHVWSISMAIAQYDGVWVQELRSGWTAYAASHNLRPGDVFVVYQHGSKLFLETVRYPIAGEFEWTFGVVLETGGKEFTRLPA
jgi:hypothetical protein